MNPEQPMPTTTPQQSIPATPAMQTDTPMDEFEYTGKKMKLAPGNIMKFIKIGGIIFGLLIILGVGSVVVMKMLASRPVAQVQNSPSPSATIVPTATPNIVYPTEYEEVLKDSQNYEKAVNSVPDDRSRIDLPQIQFGIKL